MKYDYAIIKEAIRAHAVEYSLWKTRQYLPPRNGAETLEWMEMQRNSTYDILRDGVVMEANVPDALSESKYFEVREVAAMIEAAKVILNGIKPELHTEKEI